MSDTKISALTDGVTANATDRLPAARAGANVYVTPAYVRTYILGQAASFVGQEIVGNTLDITDFIDCNRIHLSASAAPGVRLADTADGVLKLTDNSGSDFNRVAFGGTTSSFPALKRSTTYLQARLADDSAYADFACRALVNPMTSELTIATGAITATGSYHRVDTEADAASDDLDTINGGVDGMILTLRAENDARTVVVKDGTGNIQIAGDMTLDNVQDTITLRYDGTLTAWLELGRAASGA